MLEVAKASLISKVQCLQNKKSLLKHLVEFVVGGLSLSKQIDLKWATFTVIKTLKPEFSFDDIHKGTLLPAKPKRGRSSGSRNNTLNSLATVSLPPPSLSVTENTVSAAVNPTPSG